MIGIRWSRFILFDPSGASASWIVLLLRSHKALDRAGHSPELVPVLLRTGMSHCVNAIGSLC